MLPEMHVEKREPKTGHRVPVPDMSNENLSLQLEEAMKLNNDAKIYDVRMLMYAEVDRQLAPKAWTDDTLEILHKYISEYVPNLEYDEIIQASKDVLKCSGFDQVAALVRDDMCSEVFNLMLQYCLREGQKHQKDRDFIDGSGIGYLKEFMKDLKENIELTFDAKWWYKVERPLVFALKKFGINLISISNKVHPGHWSYPQGHATKSFTALQTLRGVFHLDNNCNRMMFIAACVFAHGRDGNLIHFPMDTYASGYNTSLEEFIA